MEPDGAVYPEPGRHLRYDFVPEHSWVGIPVQGLRGDPMEAIINVRPSPDQRVTFDSCIAPESKGDYLLYVLQRQALSSKYEAAGIRDVPAQVSIEVVDKPDEQESFILRMFRWWGRSGRANYFIARQPAR
ncbi:MAG: hypothetical protein NTW86_15670 [Candidatus Sumerlaeota bacterium]|nr:hypothetical protein [Candidatus Sumerlaeota bacterium]